MRIRTLAAIAALGAAMAFLPATAQASPSSNHCVIDLSANGAMSCFATFTEVVARVTGGRITTAPDDHSKAMTDPAFVTHLNEQAAAANEYILSVEYEHIYHDGSTLTAVGPHPCTLNLSDVDYWLPNMPAGWDNRVSSFRAAYDVNSGCWVKHYADPDFQGYTTWDGFKRTWSDMRNTCAPNCWQNFNDLTSSIQWS